MRTDICPHLHVYRYTYTECLAEINVGLEYGTLFLRRRRTARPISSHPRRRSGCINLTARAAHQVQSRADHAPCSRRVQRPWRQAGGRGWPKPALGVRRASLGGVAASRKGAISTLDWTCAHRRSQGRSSALQPASAAPSAAGRRPRLAETSTRRPTSQPRGRRRQPQGGHLHPR